MQNDPTAFSSLLLQLDTAAPKAVGVRQRFNPRPPGVIRPGSASDQILSLLRETGGFYTEQSIRAATGLTHSQASWSLFYLSEHRFIRKVPDATRPRLTQASRSSLFQ